MVCAFGDIHFFAERSACSLFACHLTPSNASPGQREIVDSNLVQIQNQIQSVSREILSVKRQNNPFVFSLFSQDRYSELICCRNSRTALDRQSDRFQLKKRSRRSAAETSLSDCFDLRSDWLSPPPCVSNLPFTYFSQSSSVNLSLSARSANCNFSRFFSTPFY